MVTKQSETVDICVAINDLEVFPIVKPPKCSATIHFTVRACLIWSYQFTGIFSLLSQSITRLMDVAELSGLELGL